MYFLKADFRDVVHALSVDPEYIKKTYGLDFVDFGDIYHYAAIVGGRAKIDGDPMMVALDLSIDAEFFYYITRHKPDRVLYPSSSAAYPINLQTETGAIALAEHNIDFNNMGQPDMTYGWSKLTGEYLAKNCCSVLWCPHHLYPPLFRVWRRSGLNLPHSKSCQESCTEGKSFRSVGNGLSGA